MGHRHLPPSRARRCAFVAAAVAAGALLPAPGSAAPIRTYGNATVISVDGPARLTVKSKRGTFKLRLFGVDAPQVGECGADESVAALKRLVQRRKGRFDYLLVDRKQRDNEGRLSGVLSQFGDSFVEESLGAKLIAADWARSGVALRVGQGPTPSPQPWLGPVSMEDWGPRPLRGVWAKCGGRMHLPAGEPVPTHAPAPWTITPDGVTEQIGPLALPTTLGPGTAITVASVAQVAPVELTDTGAGFCWVRVPSLQLVLWAATPGPRHPCSAAEVYGIATWGPGVTTTSRGLSTGAPVRAAAALFPRLAAGGAYALRLEQVPLAGLERVPWAWQTIAAVDEDSGKITGFLTSTSDWER